LTVADFVLSFFASSLPKKLAAVVVFLGFAENVFVAGAISGSSILAKRPIESLTISMAGAILLVLSSVLHDAFPRVALSIS
jgi:hypothetical protein